MNNWETFPIRTPYSSTIFNSNAPADTVKQQASQRADISAIHYKAAELRDFQITLYTARNDASSQDVQAWQEVLLSDMYSHYRDELVYVLFKIQTVCDADLGSINVAK